MVNAAGGICDLIHMERAQRGRLRARPPRWGPEMPIRDLCRAGFAGLLLAQAAAAAEPTPVRALTTAYNASGHDLFTQFVATPGNIVFSPYSIGTAMAMVLAGARGDTEREMTTVLRHSLPPRGKGGAQWPLLRNS